MSRVPRLSNIDRWIIAVLTTIAAGWLFVALLLIDRNIYFTPIDQLVFAPPPHWHRLPNIPGLNPQSQLGHWIDGTGSVWLSAWTDVGKPYRDPTRSLS